MHRTRDSLMRDPFIIHPDSWLPHATLPLGNPDSSSLNAHQPRPRTMPAFIRHLASARGWRSQQIFFVSTVCAFDPSAA